ncbi:MAG: hypothetical protein JSS49_02835 [Planctomycetes bacterium]|nr:hypothetical protein [Planctomycetota bacterium]
MSSPQITSNQGSMAAFLLTALMTLVLATQVHAADGGTRERAFVRALEQFDAAKSQEEYRESARTLEAILTDGFRNGAVYYNLGNAYYRAGDYGKAILNYRKAKPYRPRDPYLAANLQQALAAAPGRLTESPRPWWIHVLFWTDWLSFPAKVRLSMIGFSLAAVVATTGFWFHLPRLQWLTIALLVAATATSVDTVLCRADVTDSRRAVITGETIARKGIGNSYEPAFDQPLRDGAEFTVLSETTDWTFGHFESVGDGWVRNEFVAR